MSEISPPHVRGILVGWHGMTITFSYVISGVTVLGFTYVHVDYAWRMQFVAVAALALLLGLTMSLSPESPRWLIDNDRSDEGWTVMQKLHRTKTDPNDNLARAEFPQISAQLLEKTVPVGFVYIFTSPSTRKRAFCGLLVWSMGQSTGILFGLNVAWLGTILIGNALCLPLVDRCGRVKLLVIGGYTCALSLLIEAVLQKYYIGSNNSAGLIACTVVYMLFAACFGLFIEVPSYTYLVEIWPTHLRTQGASIGIGAYFLATIAYNSPAPTAFDSIGYKYYFVFVAMSIFLSSIMLFYSPETASLTLEEIAARFGDEIVVDLDHVHVNNIVVRKETHAYHIESANLQKA
ncbi:hypothetical protein CLAIMM_11754 [Cladophialophora immunda]|nr:hypothetical protein CLAIMM_11754 [Cladophialophora immunda]